MTVRRAASIVAGESAIEGEQMASTMTRWRPFAEIEDLRKRMEHMLEEIGSGEPRKWSLPIDLIERDDKFVMKANVPGLTPDELKIEVEDDVLTVSGRHEESAEEKEENYVRRERRVGSFSRSITLPKGVAADQVDATCKDGVVEISFPKPKEEAPTAVTIQPKTA
jgi:HSP20 family protein